MAVDPTALDPQVLSELIRIAPAVLGILVLFGIFLAYRKEIRRILPRVSGFEMLGVKLSLTDLKDWADKASEGRSETVTDKQLKAALERAEAVSSLFRGTPILWVDDHPENNTWERRALQGLGAKLDVALSNDAARNLLGRNDYELVISDLKRDSKEDPRDLVAELSKSSKRPDVIYFVYHPKGPPPPGAIALTARSDVLINSITDALERRYYRGIPE